MLALAQLLEAKTDSVFIDPLDIAVFYARAGQAESAMDWLEKAEEGRAPTIMHSLLDPVFDAFRDTPRFKALRRQLNLPD